MTMPPLSSTRRGGAPAGTLIRAMQEGVVTVDRVGRVTSWSPGAVQLWGYEPSEAIGRSIYELVRSDGVASDFPALLELVRSKGSIVETRERRRKDGTAIHTQTTLVALLDNAGRATGMLGVSRDVSEDQRWMLALEEREAQLRGLVEVMPEGVVLHDASGTIVTSNAAAEQILGLSADQLCGRTSMDPLWRAVRGDGSPFPGNEHPAMVTLRTGQPFSRVTMGVHKPDGTLTWIAVSSQPMSGAGVLATFVDITEYHEVASKLATLAVVLGASGDALWELDIATGHVEYSDRWAQMLGYEPSEIEPTAAACQRVMHPDDAPTAMLQFRRFLAGESASYEVEERLQHRDGRWLWMLVRGKIVERDERGAPKRVAGTFTDITARRQQEAELRAELARKVRELSGLHEAIDRQDRLPHTIPICMHCRNIRNDEGTWESLETYLARYSDARLSHGLCLPCMEKHFPGV